MKCVVSLACAACCEQNTNRSMSISFKVNSNIKLLSSVMKILDSSGNTRYRQTLNTRTYTTRPW